MSRIMQSKKSYHVSANFSSELKRELRFWDSVAISIGIIVGVGIFRVPSVVASNISSPLWILLAWVAGGVVSLFGVSCFAELSSRFPKTGGTYVFLREAYGDLVSFLFAWIEITIIRAGSIAAVSFVFAGYMGNFISLGGWGEKGIAVAAIFLLTHLNIRGLRYGTRTQNIFSLLKVLTLLAIAGSVFSFAAKESGFAFDLGKLAPSGGPPSLVGFSAALVAVMWTYGGWHESAFMSGEFKDTKKELPLSLIVSALLVMARYLAVNIAYLMVVPPSEMVQYKTIASEVFEKLFGSAGNSVMTLAVLISAFGALNSTIMTGGRIPFAVAQHYPRFSWFSAIDSRYETPKRSLVLNALWAAVLVLCGSFEQLLYFCQFAQWLFFALIGASIFIIRKKHGDHDGFSMAGYPFLPFIFIITAVSICLSTILASPVASLIGTGLILSGIPVFLLLKRT